MIERNAQQQQQQQSPPPAKPQRFSLKNDLPPWYTLGVPKVYERRNRAHARKPSLGVQETKARGICAEARLAGTVEMQRTRYTRLRPRRDILCKIASFAMQYIKREIGPSISRNASFALPRFLGSRNAAARVPLSSSFSASSLFLSAGPRLFYPERACSLFWHVLK